jgi:hypothetical protein
MNSKEYKVIDGIFLERLENTRVPSACGLCYFKKFRYSKDCPGQPSCTCKGEFYYYVKALPIEGLIQELKI